MTTELIDVLDENGILTGEVFTKEDYGIELLWLQL